MTENQSLPINNPAERLYVILSRASEAEHNKTIQEVLCEAMKIENNQFIRKYGELFDLINHIEKQIQQFFSPRKQKSYIAMLDDIRLYLERAIIYSCQDSNNNKWSKASPMNSSKWLTLQHFEACVEDFEKEISINKSELNNLIDEVKDLIDNVKESNLNDDLKNFVITKLLDLKQILEKYYYYGNEGVKKEILSTLVELEIRTREKQDDLTENDIDVLSKIKNNFLKVITILGVVDTLVSSPTNIDQLKSWSEKGIRFIGNAVIEQIQESKDVPKLPPSK